MRTEISKNSNSQKMGQKRLASLIKRGIAKRSPFVGVSEKTSTSSRTSSKKEVTPVKPPGSMQSKTIKTPRVSRVRAKKATSDPRDKAQDARRIVKVDDQQPQQNPPTSSLWKRFCAFLSRIFNKQAGEPLNFKYTKGDLTAIANKGGVLDPSEPKEQPKPSHRLLTCCGIFSCCIGDQDDDFRKVADDGQAPEHGQAPESKFHL